MKGDWWSASPKLKVRGFPSINIDAWAGTGERQLNGVARTGPIGFVALGWSATWVGYRGCSAEFGKSQLSQKQRQKTPTVSTVGNSQPQ